MGTPMRHSKRRGQVTRDGDVLVRRLRRLRARAAAATADDRGTLVALLDDIETVRKKLLRECARLDEEMQRASARAAAINAYARSARTIHGRFRRGH